jgi:hypothetical protein
VKAAPECIKGNKGNKVPIISIYSFQHVQVAKSYFGSMYVGSHELVVVTVIATRLQRTRAVPLLYTRMLWFRSESYLEARQCSGRYAEDVSTLISSFLSFHSNKYLTFHVKWMWSCPHYELSTTPWRHGGTRGSSATIFYLDTRWRWAAAFTWQRKGPLVSIGYEVGPRDTSEKKNNFLLLPGIEPRPPSPIPSLYQISYPNEICVPDIKNGL